MVEGREQQPEEAPRRRSSVFEMLSLPEIQMPEINHTTNKNKKLHQYQTVNNRPRRLLHLQAQIWRFLMGIGMFLHRLAPPRPPKPDFYRTIDSTIAGIKGQITLHFYVPSDFKSQKKLFTDRPQVFGDEEAGLLPERGSAIRRSIGSINGMIRRRSSRGRRWGGYPVVLNFHGGGFTLGSPYDDARWCGTVVQQLNAIVVSVDYRLAPEHPFPTAVEDGVDAVIWIHKHAAEFGIDTDKIMLSGFSSGANMAFTVPLRLYDEQTGFRREEGEAVVKDGANAGKTLDTVQEGNEIPQRDGANAGDSSASRSGSSSSTKVPPEGELLDPRDPPPSLPPNPSKDTTRVHSEAVPELPEIKIRCIVPWYPSLDYTRTREERRATCVRADQELPSLFTNLFDDSYLHPPKDVSLDSPYLSPGVAATDLLRNALPAEIIMHTCEWDMLLDEGRAFYQRLTSPEIGKHVNYTMVPGVPHAWDKAPNPLKPTPGVKEHYLKACKAMRAVLGQRDGRDPSEGPAATTAAAAAAASTEREPSMVR